MTLLEIQDLHVSYGGRAVCSVQSLRVSRGQIVAVVGESGSGKSTLAWSILGMSQAAGAGVSGSVKFEGRELVGAAESQLRDLRGNRIGMITQSPREALNPTFRLGALFERTLKLHGVSRQQMAKRTHDALAEVRLETALLRRYPNQISGGQAQRFTIALVLALGSDLILADEPTSALDVTVQADVVNMLRRLRDDHGRAVLFISHDLALVSELADEIVVMRAGSVVEQGPAKTVLNQPQNSYTQELIAAVPRVRELAHD